MYAHIEGRADYYEAIYRIKAKNGDYLTFYDKGKIVERTDDGEVRIVGLVINLTDSVLG